MAMHNLNDKCYCVTRKCSFKKKKNLQFWPFSHSRIVHEIEQNALLLFLVQVAHLDCVVISLCFAPFHCVEENFNLKMKLLFTLYSLSSFCFCFCLQAFDSFCQVFGWRRDKTAEDIHQTRPLSYWIRSIAT